MKTATADSMEIRPLVRDFLDLSDEEAALVGDIVRRTQAEFGSTAEDPSWIASYVLNATNWDISQGLFENDRLVGFYLLRDGSLSDLIGPADGIKAYDGMNGVEGIALVVDEACRGKGYGRRLRDMPAKLGYDYVFGQQLKALNNLDHWLKHRELVGDTGACWITAAILPKLEATLERDEERDRENHASREEVLRLGAEIAAHQANGIVFKDDAGNVLSPLRDILQHLAKGTLQVDKEGEKKLISADEIYDLAFAPAPGMR